MKDAIRHYNAAGYRLIENLMPPYDIHRSLQVPAFKGVMPMAFLNVFCKWCIAYDNKNPHTEILGFDVETVDMSHGIVWDRITMYGRMLRPDLFFNGEYPVYLSEREHLAA